MPQTLVTKIIAQHLIAGKAEPGNFATLKIDRLLCHEVTTPPALAMLKKLNIQKVFDPNKIIVTPDHFIPAKDEKSALMAKQLAGWVQAQKIPNYYPIGKHGVCHAIFLEQGHIGPGMVAIAGDSHTCAHGVVGAFSFGVGTTDVAAAIVTGQVWCKVPETIKINLRGQLPPGVFAKDAMLFLISQIGVAGAREQVLEFSGELIADLALPDRVPFANMAIEAGAMCGLVEPDAKTQAFCKAAGAEIPQEIFHSDPQAKFTKTLEFDLSHLEPLVATPHSPGNGQPISKLKKDQIKIDQAYLGSCTNGRIEDLRLAAEVLAQQKIASNVRMIIVPATTKVWQQAEAEGLFKIFTQAGATVSTPTCGACLGGHMGVLAPGETAIASTNRNFIGRMGSKESQVYLASPRIVATSALKGYISD